jgi:hypothetical protein
VRLRLQRLPGHRLVPDLRVRRIVEMDMPQLCRGERPTTSLMTRLVLDDGERPALTLPITADWQCLADADGDLRRLRAWPGRS